MTRFSVLPLAAALTVSACALHHVTPYVPDAANAPQTEDAAHASTNCFEASTAAEIAVCGAPALADPNRAMVQALQAQLRTATIFGRDALLASQRGWLLRVPTQCRLPDPPAQAPAEAVACLRSALADRTAELRAWPVPQAVPGGAIAQYVSLRPAAGAAPQPDPGFCAGFAQRANAALRRVGTLDPAAMGDREVAGSHGPEAAPPISVDLYDANAFGLFARRARSVTLGSGPAVISPISLTQLVEAQNTANQGGRFSSFASQTGDYGSIDVFRDGGRLLVLAADAWGSNTPASPGEAAHAGLWDVGGARPGNPPAALCLFDTYTRPAEPGPFDALPSFAPWRDVLNQIREAADLPLGTALKRDQGQLAADSGFVLLHMPLLARQQANAPGATLWLRHRHDEVLDTLFAWSAKSPANKALFDRLFSLLRPAAAELVHAYQTTEGLSGTEATQAGGIAIMELLYQSTANIAPALGAQPDVQSGTRPRYPILASPQ